MCIFFKKKPVQGPQPYKFPQEHERIKKSPKVNNLQVDFFKQPMATSKPIEIPEPSWSKGHV
jgi:hypothetical protein